MDHSFFLAVAAFAAIFGGIAVIFAGRFRELLRLSLAAVAIMTAASYGVFGEMAREISEYTHLIVGVPALAGAAVAFARTGWLKLDDERWAVPIAAAVFAHCSLLAAYKGVPFNPGEFAEWLFPEPPPVSLDASAAGRLAHDLVMGLGGIVRMLAHVITPALAALTLAKAVQVWSALPKASPPGAVDGSHL